jgi:hypothetical protein
VRGHDKVGRYKSGLKARQVFEKSRFAEDKSLDFLPVFLDFLPEEFGFPSGGIWKCFRPLGKNSPGSPVP